MKIGPSLFQSMQKFAAGKKSGTSSATVVQTVDLKQQLKEAARQLISDNEVKQSNIGEDSLKTKLLIEMFKNGKKLTAAEMAYIRKYAPEMYEHVSRIMRRREMFEQSMKTAPTKMDVQITVSLNVKQIEKDSLPEDREVLARHLADAKHEYEQTDEYKEKPNSLMDNKVRKARVRQKKNPGQRLQFVIQVYESNKSQADVKKSTTPTE